MCVPTIHPYCKTMTRHSAPAAVQRSATTKGHPHGPVGEPTRDDAPGSVEVRDALARIVASEALRTSPQLVAFLGFVVETTQRGEANRIKAYTIAVEALGRAPDFDPELDSIVRVVAGRLRRALEHYYADAGIGDPILIDLPRGSYVPVFRRRLAMHEPAAAVVSRTDADAGTTRRPLVRRLWIPLTALAAAVIASIALVAFPIKSERTGSPAASASVSVSRPSASLRPAPIIYFQPFDVIGDPPTGAFTIGRLLGKLGDAMVRFDGINVVTDGATATPPVEPADWTQYRFGGSAEYHPDGTATLSFRLVDASNGALYWSRMFDRLHLAGDPSATDEAVVREVASAIAAPFGVVWARELSAHSNSRDPRRACVIDVVEYWRQFIPAQHERVRQCLDRMVADDPTFASGFAGLAMVDLRDFYLDIARPGEPPALDRALQAALHAIKLKPDSARAYEILFVVWFARGELDQAFATAEKAVALNPYDTNIIAEYGARLVAAGQIERGTAMLNAAAAQTVIQPVGFDFARFLGAYLAGDRATAQRYAAVIENDASLYGLLARALVGTMVGDHDKAMQAIDRLVAVNPAWRANPRRQLAKFFPAANVRERLLSDLDAAGLHVTD
jgi:TolB-like protein